VAQTNVHSIAWHEQCLHNMRDSLLNAQQELQRKEAEVQRLNEAVAFRQQQINVARANGKVAFDAERFLVKRGRK
jgi:hypothetical protein